MNLKISECRKPKYKQYLKCRLLNIKPLFQYHTLKQNMWQHKHIKLTKSAISDILHPSYDTF